MAYDEGIAVCNGERLNVQCLLIKNEPTTNFDVNSYHWHQYIEILYFLKGSAYALIDEKKVLCNRGDLLIIYANEPHSFAHLSRDEYIVIKFLPEVLHTPYQTLKGFEYLFNLNIGKHSRVMRNTNNNIQKLILDAYQHFRAGGYSDELFTRADIIRLCGEIIRFWYTNGEINPIRMYGGRNNFSVIQRLLEVVDETHGAVTTSQAATMCNMSQGHFSRTFKSITNMPFMQYVKMVKISEAERLLKCTDMTITDISQILNYGSTSHFIEDFKHEKGITPKQYRKNAHLL